MDVTMNMDDRGKFKVPPLRNVALRAPFFHTGGKFDLDDLLSFYNSGGDFRDNIDPEMIQPNELINAELQLIKTFLEGALTDLRVENELPPFDRPTLQTYFRRGDSNQDLTVDVGDPIHLLEYLFAGGPAPTCSSD